VHAHFLRVDNLLLLISQIVREFQAQKYRTNWTLRQAQCRQFCPELYLWFANCAWYFRIGSI